MLTNLSSRQLLKNFTLPLLFALITTPLIHAQQHTINSFVDSSLKDKEVLKEQLSNQTNHNSFHLFSHGLSGELFLNNQWLSHDDLAAFIQPLLQDKTHLNIYGCHFAQGEKGRAAVAYLETTLGITVAASDDITGADGDWDLEVGNPINSLSYPNYAYSLGRKDFVSICKEYLSSCFGYNKTKTKKKNEAIVAPDDIDKKEKASDFFAKNTSVTSTLSEVVINVNWTEWSGENKVEVYDPADNLIQSICNLTNCYDESTDEPYSTSINLGCFADGAGYYIVMYDSYGGGFDGWSGAGTIVEVISGGTTVLSNTGADASQTGETVQFTVSGGGACAPVASVFAIQPSCTDGVAQSDGYLQISSYSYGDRYNFSTTSSYTGDPDYADALDIGSLPFQFNTGLASVSGGQDYTVRIFSDCGDFTDYTITMNEQDCTVGCNCSDYVYLNDIDNDLIHKFKVNETDGALTEIGSPWNQSGINLPHGVAIDNNGFLYIAEINDDYTASIIHKISCSGEVVDDNWLSLSYPVYNLVGTGDALYINGDAYNDKNSIEAYDLCTGTLIGCQYQNTGWGFSPSYDGQSYFNTQGWDGPDVSKVWSGPLDRSQYSTDDCPTPSAPGSAIELVSSVGSTANGAKPMGVTQDDEGNIYVVVTEGNGDDAPSYIRKFNSTGGLLATSTTDSDLADNIGWSGARGIVFSDKSGYIYVASRDDCISVFDKDLNYLSTLAVPYVVGAVPKALGILTECCPTNNNITIDTTLCAASIGDQISLQALVNCSGTICEGLWAEGAGNTGLSYNSCDNSVMITALNACGTFTLASDGAGNNSQCGAFNITVNITVNTLGINLVQTGCTDNGDGTFTAAYNAEVNWNSQPCSAGEMINVSYNGSSLGTIDPSTDSSPSIFPISLAADGNGTHAIKAEFTIAACADSTSFKTPLPCPADVSPCASTADCIGGNVFEDFNCNGVDDTEPGVQGVQIQVYDCNNNLVGTGYSDSEGDWQVCGLTDGTAYRIEHVLPEAVACWATPTHVGTDNGSDIQFLTAPACTQFSVSSPSDYCEVNSKLLTTCFVNGDPNDATVTGQDVLVGFNYDGTGKAVVAVAGNVGSTWGVAFDQQNQRYFVSTVLRRHSGIADNLGTIYVADPISGTPTVFTTLSNVGTIASNTDRGLTTLTAQSQDQQAFSKIGKVGISNIDVSEDGSTLYAVNLNTRRVVAINTTSLAETELPAFPEPGCSSGVARPWALKVYRGAIYLGVVCSGENGGSQSDLSAHIMKYENGSWSTKLSFALDYNKGCSYDYFGTTTGCGGWSPWYDDDTTDPPADYIFGYEFFSYPTPIFSDLEFTEDGSILMAFLDRSSMQYGAQNYPPYNNTNSGYEYVSGGDILVAHNVNGNLIFENNGASGEPTTTGQSNGQGPNGGEFIYEDEYLSDDAHYEVSTGGIAVLKGTNEFALSRIDPSALNSGGIGWFGSTTGQSTNTLELYAGGIANGFMSKSAGIGDVELLCAPAPLEIGNYVWCDSLNNGIQDACERGISGINVSLYDRTGALVGVTTTSATGQYYFNENNVDTTGVDAAGVANNAYTGMSYATQYFIVFGAGGQFATDQFTVGGEMYGITAMANAGSNDNIDSDVDGSNLSTALNEIPAGLPVIDMTTSATGCGEHKYDLGVTCTYSLGNQVFTDTDNSGDLNGGETGIDGVVLQLLNSDGSVYDGDPITAGDQAVTVTTANGGYYRFDDLPAGDYIVEVVASNFAATSILENLVSSTGAAQEADPNSDMDINDNGLDSQVSGATRSGVVTLGTSEPTGEAEPGTYGGGSTTGTAAADLFSNLTVDFGFYGICNLTITENTQSVCNDNGTSSNASDDYFTIDFNATAVNGGTQYQVVQGANADGTGGTVLATSNYGTAVTVGTATTFDADGTTTYAITVRDATTNTCHQEVTTTSVASCSATCVLTITENTQSSCNDNGTSNNASDDYFTIDFNATAVNGGTQYQVVQGANADGTGGTVLATSNYGTAVTVGTATTFDADGTTTYAITVRDATTNTCHQEVTTTSVASCSATCVLTITENTQSSCNDNGTSNNASDDYFTIDFNATAINGGTQYQVVQGANADGTGGTVLATSNYGTAVTVGTATTFDADGTTTYAITVRDATTNTCHQEVTTTSVASCSATCVLTITENTQSSCNDNGTSNNASDDYFTIDFNATAINGGTQYQVVQGANADGTGGTVLATSNYGTVVTVGTATTFDADGTTTYAITVRDATDNTCHQDFTTTTVAACSSCPTSICLPIQVTIKRGAKN